MRTIAWVSLHDLRGYTRLHKIDAAADGTIGELYAAGRLPERTACGAKIPEIVTDISEHTRTPHCRRCFPPPTRTER